MLEYQYVYTCLWFWIFLAHWKQWPRSQSWMPQIARRPSRCASNTPVDATYPKWQPFFQYVWDCSQTPPRDCRFQCCSLRPGFGTDCLWRNTWRSNMNQPGFAETSPKHSAPVLWGSWASLSLSPSGSRDYFIVCREAGNLNLGWKFLISFPMISWHRIIEWLRDRHLPALGHQK